MQSYVKSPDLSKVETISRHVKSHCRASRLADAAYFVYFCVGMNTLGRIAYWLAAVAIISAILISLDYTVVQAVLISLAFCPCALALEYWMPKARKPIDKVYLSLAVMVSIILLILILHFYVLAGIRPGEGYLSQKEVAPMLVNPAFLGFILTALALGDVLWAKWLSKRFKEQDRTVTFFSDRQSVTLKVADIAYVESNDTEVRIITQSGESYRNKTGIGQWENLLGEGFLRIHRSYLVNAASARLASSDAVTVGETRLPISRKYKESVLSVLTSNV